MNIYVAGKTHDYEKIRDVQALCLRTGHRITYDWTTNVQAHGAEHEIQVPTPGQAREFALNDMSGVKSAALVIALSHPRWCGTLLEIGAAIAMHIPVIILGQPYQKSVFWALPDVWLMHDWTGRNDRLEAMLRAASDRVIGKTGAQRHIRQYGLNVPEVEGRSV